MDTAEANLKRAEANEASARASVTQARATLQSDETNLAKATIRSPIDGVVLTRKVEPGQTVAASLQAPVLFTLAEDLAQMELQVDVDEADVGQVQGGPAGHLHRRRLARPQVHGASSRASATARRRRTASSPTRPCSTVDNDDLSLRPGMTGTAEITTRDARERAAGAERRAALHARRRPTARRKVGRRHRRQR